MNCYGRLSCAEIVAGGAPDLILKPVSAAVGVVDCEPLFVAAISPRNVGPGMSAIERAPDVVKE